jgi:hypothetical protein
MPCPTSRTDSANVAASIPNAARGPSSTSSSPPKANPATWAMPSVTLAKLSPSTYRSPSSTLGRIALRAALYNGCSDTMDTSSSAIPPSGITGSAISPTRAQRHRSTTTRTDRRAWRSASPDSSGALNSGGSSVNA